MFEMIPYRPGSISDDEIMGYYDQIVEEGMSDIVFYNKVDYTREDFLETVKSPGVFFYLVKYNGEVCGGAMLDGFQAKMAFAHYYTMKKTWGTGLNVTLFREVVRSLLTIETENGYLFDLIVGITPVWHVKGNRFNEKIGGVEACTIPNIIYNATKKISEPGKIFYFTRECYENL